MYGRTRSMSIEYLVAFAFFYDVLVEYLLGLSNSCKQEYHDISEQLGLCDTERCSGGGYDLHRGVQHGENRL